MAASEHVVSVVLIPAVIVVDTAAPLYCRRVKAGIRSYLTLRIITTQVPLQSQALWLLAESVGSHLTSSTMTE